MIIITLLWSLSVQWSGPERSGGSSPRLVQGAAWERQPQEGEDPEAREEQWVIQCFEKKTKNKIHAWNCGHTKTPPHTYSQQSLRCGRHRFVRTLWAGCSLAWTQTLTCSSTNQRSRPSTRTGTSRAPMPSSNPATFTPTKCSPAQSGARASRGTQVRRLQARTCKYWTW